MRLFFLLFLNLISLYAIVDIATVDFGDKPTGFSGSAYGSFQTKRGNIEKNEVEYGGRIQYDQNNSITWIQAKVENDNVRGITTDDNAFIHLRNIHQLYASNYSSEAYIQFKKDAFKNIRKRSLYGIGLRNRIFSLEHYGKLFLGLSFFDERITYTQDETDPKEHNYRLSSYLSYKLPVNKILDISFFGYYQPKIDDFLDYITSFNAEMTVHLTQVVDLSYLVVFDHDSVPALGVNKTDVVQKLALIYRFSDGDPLTAYAYNFLNSTDTLDDINTSAIISVEVEQGVKDIKDTFAGKWSFEGETFNVSLDGTGTYTYNKALYTEKFNWELISTQTQEGIKGVKAQSTKLVLIHFVDEEGRLERAENYLWSESSLVGLLGSSVRLFKRP
ncbi:DUF481 domain-containing protein [Sulfurimonas sp. MAG313]|nr:DUF481 domain-containing protein [Sulfurimonas sp. MAG313]MDF1880429.1 DUF481 domain-containing protein [Sulfurimonas sp. MAG313]